MGSSNNKPKTREELSKDDAIQSQDEILIKLTNDVIVPRLRTEPSDDYQKLTFLGEGSFASVFKVKNKVTGEIRAMKEIKKASKCTEADDKEVFNEICILQKMDHPNIMKIYEFYVSKKSYCIVNELCSGGELFEEILNKGPFNEEQSAYIMYQILHAVNYFHKMNIIHRDLKPENILISGRDSQDHLFIKICDFGTSKMFEKGQIEKKVIGSSYYIAPEVLSKNYNEKCDIWSCGVILYILLSQQPPFGGDNDVEITQNVKKGKYDIDCEPFNRCSDACRDLIKKLLEFDKEKRITAQQALEHKFFQMYKIKQKFTEIKDKSMTTKFIKNLKNYKKVSVIQETALAYLVHNFSQREDVVNAARLFNQFDNEIDGKITQKELLAALQAKLPNEKNLAEDVEKIFQNIDSDKNGFIEYEEFIRAAVDKQKFMDEKVLRFAFRYFDKDNSGTIDFDEIKEVFQKSITCAKPSEIEAALKKIISEVDTNQDGKISFDEFENIMKKMLN